MVPERVYMIFPDLLFMFGDFFAYFLIEGGKMWVGWAIVSEMIAFFDFI